MRRLERRPEFSPGWPRGVGPEDVVDIRDEHPVLTHGTCPEAAKD